MVFPGFDGGAESGGQAYDPQTGIYYVNANDLAWTGGLAPNSGGQSGQALYLAELRQLPCATIVPARARIACSFVIGDRPHLSRIWRRQSGKAKAHARLPQLEAAAVNAIVQFVLTGEDAPAGRAETVDQKVVAGGARRSIRYQQQLPVSRAIGSSSIPMATLPSRPRGAR